MSSSFLRNASISVMFCTVISFILSVMLVTMIVSSMLSYYWSMNDGKNGPSITRVSFIGNSFQFVNDLPRFMETLANSNKNNKGEFVQDSVLHGSLSFTSLLKKGNGMYGRWNTSNALFRTTISNQREQVQGEQGYDGNNNYYNDEESILLYDYGLCTVTQLLQGYDANLVEYNDNEYYTNDDGLNPCFQNSTYLEYTQRKYSTNIYNNSNGGAMHWGYVVMNDKSMRPAQMNKRLRSMKALKQKYAPLLLKSHSVPVFVMTYGYYRLDIDMQSELNMTQDEEGEDHIVPIFTSKLYRGYQLYAQTLDEAFIELGGSSGDDDDMTGTGTGTGKGTGKGTTTVRRETTSRIAPVGLIFLLIWEENYEFWQRLFFVDNYHPSPLGTYIIGCTIYSTIYNKLPPPNLSDESITNLFSRARAMQLYGDDDDDLPLPTIDDTLYIRYMIKRVVFMNHLPKSLKIYQTDEEELYDE